MSKLEISAEELRQKYDKIYDVGVTLEVDDFTTEQRRYFFKRPSMGSYDRFVKTSAASPSKAVKAFVLDNVVEEQSEALLADIEEYPALAMSLSDKLFAMLGLSKDISVKKL